MINIYETFEKPMLKILADMEIQGIKIDKNFSKLYHQNLKKRLKKFRKKFLNFLKKNLILLLQNN